MLNQKSQMVLLVGPTGSGKSTWLKKQPNYVSFVISDDILKYDFYNSEVKEDSFIDDTPISKYSKIWEYANKYNLRYEDYKTQKVEEIFIKATQKNKTIYIDNTNLSAKVRAPWIALARKYYKPVHAIEFWIDSNILYQRQSTRTDKSVPALHLKQQIRAQTHCGVGTEVDSVELIYE